VIEVEHLDASVQPVSGPVLRTGGCVRRSELRPGAIPNAGTRSSLRHIRLRRIDPRDPSTAATRRHRWPQNSTPPRARGRVSPGEDSAAECLSAARENEAQRPTQPDTQSAVGLEPCWQRALERARITPAVAPAQGAPLARLRCAFSRRRVARPQRDIVSTSPIDLHIEPAAVRRPCPGAERDLPAVRSGCSTRLPIDDEIEQRRLDGIAKVSAARPIQFFHSAREKPAVSRT